LFKVAQHVGIVGNVGSVELERRLREFGHGRGPARLSVSRRRGRPHECPQTSRNKDLEVPLRQYGIGIFPVQYLALLGDSDVTGKVTRRLSQNCRVGRATAASDGAAASVKQPELYPALAGDRVKGAVGLVQFPGAGQHAAVFVGVGVTQHDLLPSMPRRQQCAVFGRTPHSAHHVGGVAQGLDGLKQRHGHKTGVIARALRRNSSQRCQAEHRENIVLGLGSADDVAHDRLGFIVPLGLGDRSQGVQKLQTGRRHARRLIGPPTATAGMAYLAQRRAMHPGMLADIERV